jgi:hypothetical protein
LEELLTPADREVVKGLVQKALAVVAFNLERESRNGGLDGVDKFESDNNKRKWAKSDYEEQKQKLLDEEWYNADLRRRAFSKYMSEKGK